MKRLIYLIPTDTNPSNAKRKQAEDDKLEEKMIAECFKQFKADLKPYSFIKTTKEYAEARPSIIIDFPDDKYDEVHDLLRSLDIVDIIDAVLPVEEQKDRPKEQRIKDAVIKKQEGLDLSRFLK